MDDWNAWEASGAGNSASTSSNMAYGSSMGQGMQELYLHFTRHHRLVAISDTIKLALQIVLSKIYPLQEVINKQTS